MSASLSKLILHFITNILGSGWGNIFKKNDNKLSYVVFTEFHQYIFFSHYIQILNFLEATGSSVELFFKKGQQTKNKQTKTALYIIEY